jgi:hypothetical protein
LGKRFSVLRETKQPRLSKEKKKKRELLCYLPGLILSSDAMFKLIWLEKTSKEHQTPSNPFPPFFY